MKKIIFVIGILFLGYISNGQAVKRLNFGLGLNSFGLPVYGNYEIPMGPNFSIAPQIQFNLGGFNYLIAGVKGDYYFDELVGLPENFDFYGGANLGYLMWFGNYDSSNKSGLNLGLELGGRWYYKEMWALNLEFSGGLGYGTKLGLSMNL